MLLGVAGDWSARPQSRYFLCPTSSTSCPSAELTASLSVVDGVYDMKELRAAGLNLDQLTPLADVIVLNQGTSRSCAIPPCHASNCVVSS